MSVRTAASLLALAALCPAQGLRGLFDKATPHVDEALRKRISLFYQSQCDRKYRLADQAVHDDSKDVYFDAEKLTCRSFKISGITYEQNFTRARVVVDVDTDMAVPGFEKMQVHRPVPSTWKGRGGGPAFSRKIGRAHV